MKRLLIARHGAFGDQIVASVILPKLKAEGWHITFLAQNPAAQLLEANPHIDVLLKTEKNAVPVERLAAHLHDMARHYDRFIDLNASFETATLLVPEQVQYHYPQRAREKICHWNYHEYTAIAADVDIGGDFSGARFYPTEIELAQARKIKESLGGQVVCWAVSGSSPHKVSPSTHRAVVQLLAKDPRVTVILMGHGEQDDKICDAVIEAAVNFHGDASRIVRATNWSVRQSYTMATIADVVVGPETGLVHAAGALDEVASVVLLSHSSAGNLTKHFRRCTALEPERTPCFPCHRLHHAWDHCTRDEATGAALCAASISPKRVVDAIQIALADRDVIEFAAG